jgi:hypothetical protein
MLANLAGRSRLSAALRQSNAQRINTGDQLFVEFLAKLADDVINSFDAIVRFARGFRYALFEPVEFGFGRPPAGPSHYWALFAISRPPTLSGPTGLPDRRWPAQNVEISRPAAW